MDGRALIWDRDTVLRWWDDNKALVGRHTEERPIIAITPAKFGEIMHGLTREIDEESPDSRKARRRDLVSIRNIDLRGVEVELTFESISDAMLFKLKYA